MMLYPIQKYEDNRVWCCNYITEDGAGTSWEILESPEDGDTAPVPVSIRDVLLSQLAELAE